MKILAIDTSNYPLGVSLMTEDTIVGEYITYIKKNHSVRAMPAIEHLLKECDWTPKELEKIVVAKGPGSYTGVRIGVTIAKTLAWSLKIPIVGVSSLAVMSSVGRYFNGYICPLVDARRGQIYTGLYSYHSGQQAEVALDCNVLAVDWLMELKEKNQPVLFVGNDVSLHKKSIQSILGDQAVFNELTEQNPRPSELGILGMNKQEEDTHSLVPNYIRLAEAEVKWLEAQTNQRGFIHDINKK
ncbi:tRNA (adenosine(37)-N6)-threonylcarbamoyltransferase complex dimerization subunit type 1 TsaB [Bacillus sp. 2205SS5-2]|uniref:tRNA (adenosine(37)-N6)-threonylcarbamoyltransferase complex dimerization subunit type 1 TsaB n=1 Tax=Bacillus sp. 2205SS5-2 TaxID=3109031 RepID=UPI00300406BE